MKSLESDLKYIRENLTKEYLVEMKAKAEELKTTYLAKVSEAFPNLDEAKKVIEKPLFKSMLKTHSISKQEGKCIPGLDSSYNIRYIVDRLARNEDYYKLLVNKEFKELTNMFKESKAISSDIPSSVLQFVDDMKISLLDDNMDYSHLPTKYSLLNIVDSSKIRDNMKEIVNYINSIN